MIHINREQVKKPAVFNSSKFKKAVEKYFNDPVERRFNYRLLANPEIKKAMFELFHGICVFCEDTWADDIEHFRPKKRAMNLDGTISEEHYWWLAYEWTNLYMVCGSCNHAKRTRFPVRGQRANSINELAYEEPLLLDPCLDKPEEHLYFSSDGVIIPLTERGRITIEVFTLNRQFLIEARRNAVKNFHYRLQFYLSNNNSPKVLASIKGHLDGSERHTAVCRQYLQEFISKNPQMPNVDKLQAVLIEQTDYRPLEITKKEKKEALAQVAERKIELASYSVEDQAQDEVYFSGAKRIEKIEINNFRSIKRLELDFPSPKSDYESWLMLIGENGTGKSSILQAVALALMGEAHCNQLGLEASRFVHKNRSGRRARSGFVKVYLTNMSSPITLKFKSNSNQFEVEPKEPKALLLGYGSTRLLTHDLSEAVEQSKYIRVKNLFDPTARLDDGERWLENKRRLGNEQFKKVQEALKDLLLLGEEDLIIREKGEVKVKIFDTKLCLHELSDGFQSILALSMDIMIALLEKWKHARIDESEAIVLLDEIEVHLHPVWKMEIVKRLRRCFPRISFLVTTHDPLCLKGLYDGEIVKLERDEEEIIAITGVPSVNDLRADQILTSFMFNLPTTRNDETVQKIARYSDLLSKKKKSSEESKEMHRLRRDLDATLTTKSTPTQQIIGKAIERAITEFEPPQVIKKLADKENRLEGKKKTLRMTDDVKMEIKRQLKQLFEE
jgi:uncharacterized protein (TIGR02646 family)